MAANKIYAQILLEEFEGICSDNDIAFQTVWGPTSMGCGVLMTASNCKKFMNAVADNLQPARAIESWGNSSIYPDDTVRYVATDSTSYNILDFNNYVNHGVFVEINIARIKDESLSGKSDAVIESMLKRTAEGFSKKGKVKFKQVQEMLYNRALAKAGSIGALKEQVFNKILSQPDVVLNEKTAAKYKYKKYNADYIRNCIVEEDISSQILFANDEFVETISSDLAEARKLRSNIDSFKKTGRDNMKIAENAWNTVCKIDEEIKGEIE